MAPTPALAAAGAPRQQEVLPASDGSLQILHGLASMCWQQERLPPAWDLSWAMSLQIVQASWYSASALFRSRAMVGESHMSRLTLGPRPYGKIMSVGAGL